MGFKISWADNNTGEDGHRLYKSTSPIDPQNLPTPLAELGPDVTEYIDGDVVEGNTYYYRVGAYVGSIERVSSELVIEAIESSPPTSGLIFQPDLQNPSGGVITDLVGTNDGTLFGPATVVTDSFGTGLSFNGTDNYIDWGKILQYVHRGQPFTLATAYRITDISKKVPHHILASATSSQEIGFNMSLDNRQLSGSNANITTRAVRQFIAKGVGGNTVDHFYQRDSLSGVIIHINMSDGTTCWIYEGDVLKDTEASITFNGDEVASHNLRTGLGPGTNTNYANMVVYRIRAYDRILTASELTQLKEEVLY